MEGNETAVQESSSSSKQDTPTYTPSKDSIVNGETQKDNKLPAGAIVGIVIGILVVAAVIAVCVYIFFFKDDEHYQKDLDSDSPSVESGPKEVDLSSHPQDDAFITKTVDLVDDSIVRTGQTIDNEEVDIGI